MASKNEDWVRALVKGAAGKIGGTIGAAVLLWLTGLLSPLWSWVQNALGSLWTHLMAQSSWPNWLAYVISLAAAAVCLRWALRQWRNRSNSTWRFHQLSFMGVLLRWEPTSGLPRTVDWFCPQCDTRLVYEITFPDFYEGTPERIALRCETCNCQLLVVDGDRDTLNGRFIREIDRLQRTGEWKKHVHGIGGPQRSR